ncbi:hypothetical protein [Halostagnicola sp. A-GB9-2]|uniref:hypothetical protein n=1 Tax=Halostagnicola sp. A-GB9-2 TaxID=3048066 RepID=UPI0024BFC5E6|nr:hypothetical protein [Halostagnicola sp. A-GB9-2]MDJ1434244.1 hypothetical protein [Halostagnicola sp. A-GB9-2]
MFRTIIGLIGVIITLFPAKIRYLYEQFALKNPDAVNVKPWFIPAIRAEGLLIVLVSVFGGKVYRMSLYLLGLAGAVALFFPRRALRISANYSYEEPERIEWNKGLVQAIRCFGVLYLLIALDALTNLNRDPNDA